MKKILSLVAVAAIAYGVVSVAAANLPGITTASLPQAGAPASITGGCADGASIAYVNDGTDVTKIKQNGDGIVMQFRVI